jgi:hypothetical protein
MLSAMDMVGSVELIKQDGTTKLRFNDGSIKSKLMRDPTLRQYLQGDLTEGKEFVVLPKSIEVGSLEMSPLVINN